MDKKARQDKYEQQTKDMYVAVGKFAVHFEHMCQALRSGITFMLHAHGLTNQQITTILLADLTAFPLQSIFSALIAESVKLTDESRRIVNNIMKRCHKLTEERNDVIHNAWFIGWASPQDTNFSNTSAMKPHRNKKGGGYKVFKSTVEDFLQRVTVVDELTVLINRLWGCISIDRQIENNFIFDTDGNVREPSK